MRYKANCVRHALKLRVLRGWTTLPFYLAPLLNLLTTNTLQHTYNTLQHKYNTLQHTYNTLQHAYNTLQHTYNTLQHFATRPGFSKVSRVGWQKLDKQTNDYRTSKAFYQEIPSKEKHEECRGEYVLLYFQSTVSVTRYNVRNMYIRM